MQDNSSPIEQRPLVSIVVPVYNVAQYLDECLEHLIGQTYENIEIVLVDDGSTDESGAKCDEWVTADGRVRVIHQNNQGLSMARNNGLAETSGEYVAYIDSDDYCLDEYIEKLLSALMASHADVCFCSYSRVGSDSETNDTRIIPAIAQGNLEQLASRILHDDLPPCAWAKLFTKEFANKALFDKGVLFEDTRMWTRLITEIDDLRFCSISEPLYQYRITNQSSIMLSYHAERERGIVEAWEAMCLAATQRFGDNMTPYTSFRRVWMWFEVLDRAIFFGEASKHDYCDEAVRYLRTHADDVYSSDVFSSGRKMGMRILSVSKPLYVSLRRATKKRV